MSDLELAKILHEAGREAVEKNCVVRKDIPVKRFLEWDELDDAAKQGRIIQARYLLERFAIIPIPDDLRRIQRLGRAVVDARYYHGDDGWDKLNTAICDLEGAVGRS